MKETITLSVTSLFSVLLLTFHLADDIARGFEKGGLSILIPVPIVVLWLCATLTLGERRWGYIVILIGSLLQLGVPVIHMMGKGVGVGARTSGSFFFAWTLIMIAVAGLFSVVLSIHGLWRQPWRRP
jgi:hypothetical protein